MSAFYIIGSGRLSWSSLWLLTVCKIVIAVLYIFSSSTVAYLFGLAFFLLFVILFMN